MKKKAQDLKPGDVVQIEGKGACSFLYASRTEFEDTVWAIFGKHSNGCFVKREVSAGDWFEVESPTLTPAQQHAEELLDLVRKMAVVAKYAHTMSDSDVAAHNAANVDRAHEVLAKIDPPKPPSVEELAEALDALSNAQGAIYRVAKRRADELIGRARQAGYLGKDAQ